MNLTQTARDNNPKNPEAGKKRVGKQCVRPLSALDSKNFLIHLLIDHGKKG